VSMSVHEVIVLFDLNGKAFHWHDENAETGYVPDSDDLFDVIWDNRHRFAGFAHTHPWNGSAAPSGMDLTTFEAIEKSLGKRCLWPVVSFTEIMLVVRNPVTGDFVPFDPNYLTVEFDWIDELRRRSGSTTPPRP